MTRPKHLRRTLGAALGAAVLTFAAVPTAHAACAKAPTTKAFAKLGDNADYSLAPAGSFETGVPGWSLSGASVASDNETWKVHGSSDSKALAVGASGTAVSPSFCVGIEHPTFRFFARRTSGTWGTLNVKLRFKDANGTHDTVVGSVGGSDTAWHPSASIGLASVLGLWNADQSASVQFVFAPDPYGGAWAIDDVYIDPYSKA